MIIDAIVTFFLSVVSAIMVVASWPGEIPSSLSYGAQELGGWLLIADGYFPIGVALILIAAGFAFDLACTGVAFLIRAYTLIPAKAT